ncbi:hypothetical protein GIB67_028331 [Kingdonia uniflora]|uniref:Uncharacterized protein n=1 Tax=Kingdonia uniflora TaxID=39325 RepID=A0A7J7MHP3_9MAGN|nr:hypothetical protein GIB67_028331 [Kingdonia uniflora]
MESVLSWVDFKIVKGIARSGNLGELEKTIEHVTEAAILLDPTSAIIYGTRGVVLCALGARTIVGIGQKLSVITMAGLAAEGLEYDIKWSKPQISKEQQLNLTRWTESNTEKIFYGLDDINDAKEMIIVNAATNFMKQC